MIPRRHRAPPRAAAARRAGSRATTPSLRRRVRRVRFRLAPSRSPPTRDGRFRRYSRRPPSRKSREFARLRDARTTRAGAVPSPRGWVSARSVRLSAKHSRRVRSPSRATVRQSAPATRARPRCAASNKTVVAAPFCLVSERPTTRRRDGGSFGVTAEPVSKTGSARARAGSRVVASSRLSRLSLSARRERMWFYVASARGAPPSPDSPSAAGAVAGLATGMGFCPVACAVATSA